MSSFYNPIETIDVDEEKGKIEKQGEERERERGREGETLRREYSSLCFDSVRFDHLLIDRGDDGEKRGGGGNRP